MKKIIAILSAIAALVACVKEVPIVEEPVQEENQEIKVNINITREGIQDTKATVKTGWAAGDVVFVFINGVAAPKYLELKRVVPEAPENPYWKATCSKGMVPGDLGTSGTMTALYLPYGSNFIVNKDKSGNFAITDSGGHGYRGHFYYTKGATYTYDSGTTTFSTKITLSPAMPEGDDKLVHFDVTGFSNDYYWVNQDYMKPIVCSGVSATDGTVGISIGKMGERFRGFYDNESGIVSFSGVLDASAVGGEAKTFRFLIHDFSDGKAYFREIVNKTISGHKYIGLGAKGVWTQFDSPYFSAGPTKLVKFAPGNLQYRASDGKWRFAQHQYDIIGDGGETFGNVAESDNRLIASDYAGWIDLFGWGTSGWDNSKKEPSWINYQPWSTDNTDHSDVYPKNKWEYGPAYDSAINKNLQGGNAHGDWGIHNNIYSYNLSSFDPAGTWRTLTNGSSDGEMRYLLNTHGGSDCRYTYTSFDIPSESAAKYASAFARYVKATVAGIEGLIIFPDYYRQPGDAVVAISDTECFNVNTGGFGRFVVADNTNWSKMETAGAVFLPVTGVRFGPGSTVEKRLTNDYAGGYWNSTRYPSVSPENGRSAYYFRVHDGDLGHYNGTATYVGMGVRLVRDLN